MLEKNKRIMSMSLCTILFSTVIASTSVQAKSNNVETKSNVIQAKSGNIYSEDIEITEDFARERLSEMGFSKKEADKLIKEFPVTKENMVRNPGISSKSSLGLMSSPNPGDTDTTQYTITEAHLRALGFGAKVSGPLIGLGLTKADWGAAIIKTIGWKGVIAAGVVSGVAATCAYMYFDGYKGVIINVTKTYMYGDGLMTYFWGITGMDAQRFK